MYASRLLRNGVDINIVCSREEFANKNKGLNMLHDGNFDIESFLWIINHGGDIHSKVEKVLFFIYQSYHIYFFKIKIRMARLLFFAPLSAAMFLT